MSHKEKIAKLIELDNQARAIRSELGLDRPDEKVWSAKIDFDRFITVEADGYGGGAAIEWQDCGGCDRLNIRYQFESDINAAIQVALRWLQENGES